MRCIGGPECMESSGAAHFDEHVEVGHFSSSGNSLAAPLIMFSTMTA